ncbi:MAG: hypothetical protein QGH74_05405 [Candidatus Brocadiia bacterium]|nr:hypothetical protein [Candidatus Brocadiia bacterium]
MVAARRSAGSGTVVLMVIAIVVAFVAIGASVFLLQQLSRSKNTLRANQDAFEEHVEACFVEEGWGHLQKAATPGEEAGEEANVRFSHEAFEAVRGKLEDAATYEEVTPVTGWEIAENAKSALDGSPLQAALQPRSNTLRELLERYESEYTRLIEREAALSAENRDLTGKLFAQNEDFTRELDRITNEFTLATQRGADAVAEAAVRHDQLRREIAENRDEKLQAQEELDGLRRAWGAERGRLDKEVAYWRARYFDWIGHAEEEGLKPDGELLAVDRGYEIVTLAGGEDAGRQPNTKYVVYSVSPAGGISIRGRVVINRVLPLTSIAAILGKVAPMMTGDQFVAEPVWDRFHAPPPHEATPVVAYVPPAVETEEDEEVVEEEEEPEVAPEEVPPAEDEEGIFGFDDWDDF